MMCVSRGAFPIAAGVQKSSNVQQNLASYITHGIQAGHDSTKAGSVLRRQDLAILTKNLVVQQQELVLGQRIISHFKRLLPFQTNFNINNIYEHFVATLCHLFQFCRLCHFLIQCWLIVRKKIFSIQRTQSVKNQARGNILTTSNNKFGNFLDNIRPRLLSFNHLVWKSYKNLIILNIF